ncbi:DNA-directed RNA polymerase subunit omega [Fusobacterium necrophorum subsp. funduliforme]|uniref:DNA-directed RNA polymerase subunit omega n=4 Tax=Fusobacterium necrophorum TaxID=859 RepID=A0AAN3VU96_9FUSO|nr:DNA-directed RNA polymerase subunit omega [Fusobacterium necrophorum]AVQ20519.1 DNA-directed RNA polymerase subunit omega [Fusobacterium necrophorum subsp. funduliforme]AYV92268.1 DNA-directed RNA polymerase subunit omega [Fusobacterium necrophorum subsp. funduliforme]AYV94205.1 DNA-directed RNA polymerase subunit omega [Fusobacterium necrophorum subsp. funduliforme]EFS22725.1 DNA-directed RNA polymerase, omega subunit [Fusobacterium necrophorum D12]EIJ72047.1 DNA-directed RNA polymerase, o
MKKDITYDELLEKIPNKYILTIVGGERARELHAGATPLTKTSKKDTDLKKVFREIIDGKIHYEADN